MVLWVILISIYLFLMETVFTTEQKLRHARIKRVKKLLRYMPRRATLHRYPFLKYFVNFARNRSYLWSFRSREVIPALYAGCIVAFMPLQGIHLPIAFAMALIFRANLMILVALQFVSNPITLFPIYWLDYVLGSKILDLLGSAVQQNIVDGYTMETGLKFGRHGLKAARAVLATMIGGMVVGYIFGLVSSILYQIGIKRLTAKASSQPSAQNIKTPNQ